MSYRIENWSDEYVGVIIIMLGALVIAGVLAYKFGISEGSDLAQRTSIENPEYQGPGPGLFFCLIVISFVVGVVLIPTLDINGVMRTGLASMAIPFMLSGTVIGFISGKETGFSEVMHEKIKRHKALLKQEKKKIRADKFKKLIRFWE